MLINERRWIEPTARVVAITRADKRRQKFAHFKMEMGKVEPVRGPNRRDLLTSPHILARLGEHLFNVPIIRLHILALAVFDIGVQHDHDVAPAGSAVAGEQDTPIGDRINRVAQIAVLTADPI